VIPEPHTTTLLILALLLWLAWLLKMRKAR
jgi:hypothetical protein